MLQCAISCGRHSKRGKYRSRPEAARVGRANLACAGETDTARTHGIRAEALSRTKAEDRRRNAEHDGRDSEEHAVSRDPEVARRAGGYEMKVSRFRMFQRSQANGKL